MSCSADQTYQVHCHTDGTAEAICIPVGDKHRLAIPLSSLEAEIFETFIFGVSDRIDPGQRKKMSSDLMGWSMSKKRKAAPTLNFWGLSAATLHGGFLGLFLATVGLVAYGSYKFGKYELNVLNDGGLSFMHGLVGFCAGRIAELHWPCVSAYAEKVAVSPDCAFVFRRPAIYSWFAIHESSAWQIIGLSVLIFAAINLTAYTTRQICRFWRQAGNRQPKPVGDW